MLYRTGSIIDEVIQSLGLGPMVLFRWFNYNQMKISISKCHLVNKLANLSYNLWKESLFGNSQEYIQKGNYENKR